MRTTIAEQKADGSITTDRTLALAEDKETLVNEGDVLARHALAAEGETIPAEDVKRLRLVVVNGKVKQSPKDPGKTTTTTRPARTTGATRE